MKYFIIFDENNVLKTRRTDRGKYTDQPLNMHEVPEELFYQTINEIDGEWRRDPITGNIEKHDFPPLSDERKQAILNQESRTYLLLTDWYVIRHIETGQEIPEDVLQKRADARSAVID